MTETKHEKRDRAACVRVGACKNAAHADDSRARIRILSWTVAMLRVRAARRPAVLTLCLLLFAYACTGPAVTWYKGGATQGDFSRDSYECERDTRGTFGPRPTPVTHGQMWGWYAMGWDSQVQGFFAQCMTARGWTTTVSSRANQTQSDQPAAESRPAALDQPRPAPQFAPTKRDPLDPACFTIGKRPKDCD